MSTWYNYFQGRTTTSTTTKEDVFSPKSREDRIRSIRRDVESGKDRIARMVNPSNPFLPYFFATMIAGVAFGGMALASSFVKVINEGWPHE